MSEEERDPTQKSSLHPRRSLAPGGRLAILVVALAGLIWAAAPARAGQTAKPVATDRYADRALVPGETTLRADEVTAVNTGPSLTRVALSLGAVALLIVSLGWVYRRMLAAQQHRNSGAAVSLVSRSLLTPKHQVLVLRAGRRLLVVGDSGHGMNLLCEITEPAEVAALLGEEAPLEDYEPLPDEQSEPFEEPPQIDVAHSDVRSLIERVRSLAGQMSRPTSEANSREMAG